jgi:hypothetical protein
MAGRGAAGEMEALVGSGASVSVLRKCWKKDMKRSLVEDRERWKNRVFVKESEPARRARYILVEHVQATHSAKAEQIVHGEALRSPKANTQTYNSRA